MRTLLLLIVAVPVLALAAESAEKPKKNDVLTPTCTDKFGKVYRNGEAGFETCVLQYRAKSHFEPDGQQAVGIELFRFEGEAE